ncbi:CASP protein 4D1 [Spatholobus suberectus]|nr:CASP protein 4D1 [Spatholobus suberectus]
MVTKRVANSMLVLRIVSIATAVATIALLVTNNSTFDNGAELKYQDFTSYSLVVAIAAIACAYCIVQLPFAIYYAIRQKRLISNRFMPEFDFYGDKVTSLLLATGIGAGFVLSVELKKFIDSKTYGSNDYKSTYNKIFIRGFIASTFLLITFLSMVVISFISSNNRSKAYNNHKAAPIYTPPSNPNPNPPYPAPLYDFDDYRKRRDEVYGEGVLAYEGGKVEPYGGWGSSLKSST